MDVAHGEMVEKELTRMTKKSDLARENEVLRAELEQANPPRVGADHVEQKAGSAPDTKAAPE